MGWSSAMSRARLLLGYATCAATVTLAVAAVAQLAQTADPHPLAVTPSEMAWTSQGPLAAQGMEQLNLVGDPSKPGPYTVRLKFPKGLRIAPHTHPSSREVTILSGVYATGYGKTFQQDKLKILPAGSFYTEPANLPHFIEVEEDTVLQVSGTGPTRRNFLNSPTKPN